MRGWLSCVGSYLACVAILCGWLACVGGYLVWVAVLCGWLSCVGGHLGFLLPKIYNKMNCELMLTYDTPAYMLNVYKNQLSRQTGSMNLTGPKTLPTIWYTYMKLVTKYRISAINSCSEKCDEKYFGTD